MKNGCALPVKEEQWLHNMDGEVGIIGVFGVATPLTKSRD